MADLIEIFKPYFDRLDSSAPASSTSSSFI